jgi:hypothetical protein
MRKGRGGMRENISLSGASHSNKPREEKGKREEELFILKTVCNAEVFTGLKRLSETLTFFSLYLILVSIPSKKSRNIGKARTVKRKEKSQASTQNGT